MANEKRLIDANAFFDKLEKLAELMRQGEIGEIDLNLLIAATPTVDAVEVVHSWWEKSAEGYRICHHCKADVAIFSGHKNYCPNCGAKMDGDSDA